MPTPLDRSELAVMIGGILELFCAVLCTTVVHNAKKVKR